MLPLRDAPSNSAKSPQEIGAKRDLIFLAMLLVLIGVVIIGPLGEEQSLVQHCYGYGLVCSGLALLLFIIIARARRMQLLLCASASFFYAFAAIVAFKIFSHIEGIFPVLLVVNVLVAGMGIGNGVKLLRLRSRAIADVAVQSQQIETAKTFTNSPANESDSKLPPTSEGAMRGHQSWVEEKIRSDRRVAFRNMVIGGIVLICGVSLTQLGESVAKQGESYLIFWGAMVFGAIQCLVGILQSVAVSGAALKHQYQKSPFQAKFDLSQLAGKTADEKLELAWDMAHAGDLHNAIVLYDELAEIPAYHLAEYAQNQSKELKERVQRLNAHQPIAPS